MRDLSIGRNDRHEDKMKDPDAGPKVLPGRVGQEDEELLRSMLLNLHLIMLVFEVPPRTISRTFSLQ